MRTSIVALVALAALAALASPIAATPAFAGASGFTVVNGTGAAIASLAVRRVGTSEWRPVAAAPAPGGRSPVQFSDADCAFDLQARLANGTTVVWSGVNLCEVNAVTLQRRPSGETWVDYD